MKKIVFVFLLLLAVGGGAVAAWWYDLPGRLEQAGWLSPPTEERQLYGNVDIREVSLGFRVGGRLAEVAVDEGDAVKAGDRLARLDEAPYRYAVVAAEENVNALRATLDKLVAGPRQSEIAQTRAALSADEASLDNARLAYERARKLRSQGTVAQSVLDQASAELKVVTAKVEASKAALALLQEGTRAEDIAAARAQLASAEASLAAARVSLADTELRAPSEGVVLTRVSEPGAIVAGGATVFVLSLSEPVWVRAYIGETDLGRIHPGLKVKVTADGLTGAGYEGTVGYISPVAEFTPKTVETPDLRTDLVYRFRIVVAHPGKDLRQGMPVTITLPPAEGGTK